MFYWKTCFPWEIHHGSCYDVANQGVMKLVCNFLTSERVRNTAYLNYFWVSIEVLFGCYMAGLMLCEAAAVLAHVLCTPCKHPAAYNVTAVLLLPRGGRMVMVMKVLTPHCFCVTEMDGCWQLVGGRATFICGHWTRVACCESLRCPPRSPQSSSWSFCQTASRMALIRSAVCLY